MHRIAFAGGCLLIFLLLSFSSLFAQGDPGNPDTVRVGTVQVDPQPTPVAFSVPVTLYNDETLGAASLGIYYNSTDVTIDSISLVGGAAENAINQSSVNATSQYGLIGFVYFPNISQPVQPGDSLLATLWFTLDANAPDQTILLDSGFVPPAGAFILTTLGGTSLEPQFKSGEIIVGEGTPPIPEIDLNPESFSFSATVGDPNPPGQVLNIINSGEGVLLWSASWNSSWLNVAPASGTAPSNPSVSVNISGLGAGVYQDTITVSGVDASNSPQLVPVTLTLAEPAPEIELSPDEFYFIAQQDASNPPDQQMTITNVGGGVLAWSAINSSTWLTLSSYSGGSGETIDLMVDITGLPYGIYIDTIEVSDPNATNSPQFAEVTLELVSSFPVLEVAEDSFVVAAAADSNPYVRTIHVINGGGGTMNYSLASGETWIDFNPQNGTTTDTAEVSVTFLSTGLPLGFHYDTIVVSSTNADDSPQEIPVFMWVMSNPPSLSISTNSLNFVGFECQNIPPIADQTFEITSPGLEDLDWTATWNSGWLDVVPSADDDDATVTVSVNETGLAPGIYVDTIHIDATWSLTPDEEIVVTFEIEDFTGQAELLVSTTYQEYIFLAGNVGVTFFPAFTISNGSSGCMDWYIEDPYPWLNFLPVSGSNQTIVFPRVDGGGLPLGKTSGQFVVRSDGAINDSTVVDFDLYITQFGDANCDGEINVSDAVWITNYIFIEGPEPCPRIFTGDVNCSYDVDISDVVYIINKIFVNGPNPCLYDPIIYPGFDPPRN